MSQVHGQQPPKNPAEAYEQSLVTQIFQPLARQVIQIAQPQAGDRVLDVASGTGICLREVAHLTGNACQLVGLDLNPAMIEVGRTIAEDAGLQIDWYQGTADELPFDDKSFDWVLCQHGLQFFPDRPAALSEMWRVLDDGGQVIISVWQDIERHPYTMAIDEAGVQHIGDHILWTPVGPFSLGDPDKLAQLIGQAGFQDIQVSSISFETRREDPVGALKMDVASATAAVPALQKMSDDERADLVNGIVSHLEPTLAAYVEDGELVSPWHANVATARK